MPSTARFQRPTLSEGKGHSVWLAQKLCGWLKRECISRAFAAGYSVYPAREVRDLSIDKCQTTYRRVSARGRKLTA